MEWHPEQQQEPHTLHGELGGGEGPWLEVEGGGAAVVEDREGGVDVEAGAAVDWAEVDVAVLQADEEQL
jgi:hypothetical protein